MTVEKTISAGGRLTAGSTPLRRLWAERRQLYAESDAALKINTEDGDKRSTALAGAVLSLDQTIGYVPAIDLGDVLIKLKVAAAPLEEDSKHDPFSSDERCLLSALDDLARLIETDGWAATDGQAA